MVDDEMALVFGRDNRVNRAAIRRLGKYVVPDINLSRLRIRLDEPDENVMAHWLRINLRLARRRFTLHTETAARVQAGVELEAHLARWLAALVSRHAAVSEKIVANVQALGNVMRESALMRHARIVDIIEEATFHRDITGAIPKFHGVAEANPLAAMPHCAADKSEIALANNNVSHADAMISVNARILKTQVFQNDIGLSASQFSRSPQRAFNGGVLRSRI